MYNVLSLSGQSSMLLNKPELSKMKPPMMGKTNKKIKSTDFILKWSQGTYINLLLFMLHVKPMGCLLVNQF